jgi:hypothetical protein
LSKMVTFAHTNYVIKLLQKVEHISFHRHGVGYA